MKKWFVTLVILAMVFSSAFAVYQFKGMCPYSSEKNLSLKNQDIIIEFSENGSIENIAMISSMFDAVGSVEIMIDKYLFEANSFEVSRDRITFYGQAGNSQTRIEFSLLNNVINMKIFNSTMRMVKLLITPCDFHPVFIRNRGKTFIQARHVAYAFYSPGSVSMYIAGKLVFVTRDVKNEEGNKVVSIDIVVDKDIDSILANYENVSEVIEYRVEDKMGNSLPYSKIVLQDNGKVVDVSTSDKEGNIIFHAAADKPEFSHLYIDELYVSKVEGNKIIVSTSRSKGFRWPPYMSGLTDHSVYVNLRLYSPDKAYVKVLETGEICTDDLVDTFHSIKVDGLKPNAEYTLLVKAGTLEEKLHVKTTGAKEFKFIVYGDTRTNIDWHKIVADEMAKEKALFLIHTGDIVESGDRLGDWDNYFQSARNLFAVTPMFPTLGNHERNSEWYYQAFPGPKGGGDFYRRWYSYRVGEILFIVLDSDVAPGTGLYKTQLEWLKSILENSDAKYRIVYFHHPFFTNSPNREPNLREDWKELFEKYHVDAVFNGHIHHYERFLINGVTYVTTGGGGAPLGYGLLSKDRKYLPGTMAGHAGYIHYIVAQVKDDGIYFTVKAVAKYDWGKFERVDEILDSFVIKK
ncbi:MAG: metallophosphoesterase [Thermotogaceae bacterium]|nr:metallophosphoesterase [Thermotogaceae bacterium]